MVTMIKLTVALTACIVRKKGGYKARKEKALSGNLLHGVGVPGLQCSTMTQKFIIE